ncbi:MAG: DoxX family protein [Actinomycetes bacterium]
MPPATSPRTGLGWREHLPTVGLVVRLILAAVWLYAGLVKLFEPGGARLAVIAYRIFPPSLVTPLGYALPAAEVVIGLFLLLGIFTRLAAIASAVLMLAFVAGIASVWARGYNIDCGCFGGGGDTSAAGRNLRYTKEIARDTAFALLSAWLIWRPRTLFSLDRIPEPEDQPA